MPEAIKMSEAQKIQKAVEKVREMMCSLDKNPFQEYWWNDHRYSPTAQPFHALSSANVHPYSLPDTWGEMMNANRAHLVIMLREAGAGHDPFRNAEWSSTPAQVWENIAQMEQLPDLKDADLSGVDFKWANLIGTNLKGTDLSRDRPQMGRPHGRRPDGRQPLQHRPTLRQPDGSQPAGRKPERSHRQPDKPDPGGPDWGQHGRGQHTLRLFERGHQAGRSHRAGLTHPTDGNQRVHQEHRATSWEKTRPNRPARKERYNSHTPCAQSKEEAATMTEINNINDLIRVLQEHPEWRQALRDIILDERLARLPQQMDQRARPGVHANPAAQNRDGRTVQPGWQNGRQNGLACGPDERTEVALPPQL